MCASVYNIHTHIYSTPDCVWRTAQAAEGAAQLLPAANMTDRNQQLERAVSGAGEEHKTSRGFEEVMISVGVV